MAIKSKPTGNPDWKGELKQLLRDHNALHSLREKAVSFNTQSARAEALFRIFALLRKAGFLIGPESLGGRHVEFLMGYWTANPAIEEGLRKRGSKLAMLDAPYSPAYIQQMLSFLRALCEWIDKPGLVLPAGSYVDDPALVCRSTNATRDRTWSGALVDVNAMLEKVYKADPVVGLQLEIMLAFGLRKKEAVMFCPSLAEVPAHALPAGVSPGSYVAFVKVKRGTKGGRVRYTAIRNDAQRQALERAKNAAPRPGMHIGRPGLTLKQSLKRFANVVYRCGISLAALGVTSHGARHEFANDLYFELTGLLAPIKGGPVNIDPDAMKAAYLDIATQLGHGRPRITGAYLGGRRPVRKQSGDSSTLPLPTSAEADENGPTARN